MASAAGQIFFLLFAATLGFNQESVGWLIPLTLVMGLFGWLTDHYWKIRFYDIYSAGDWAKFWTETLVGMAVFITIAYFTGRLIKRISEFSA